MKIERLEDMAGIYGDREGLKPHEPWRFCKRSQFSFLICTSDFFVLIKRSKCKWALFFSFSELEGS